MKNSLMKFFIAFLSLLFIVLLFVEHSFGWGFWAHKEINKRAIQLLPAEMKNFFLKHAEYITEHAIDPDIRRSKNDSLEQYNHYLDIDYYGRYPFNELPRNYGSAVAKFSADTVLKQGVLPWRIAAYTDSLTNAMKRKDEQKILHFASDLGHYVADAHVPLHAIVDYDGVQRGQRGIHKRWESDMTERYGKRYSYPTEGTRYIENPLMEAFVVILDSYMYSDSVFYADVQAVRTTPNARSFKGIHSSGDTVFVYSDAYYESLQQHDRGLVERRMQRAIIALASFWYTAWINAGKPRLALEKNK
jgi:hypothetical protein